MKTETHISLAHFHFLLPKPNALLLFFSAGLKTISLFCQPRLTCKIILFLFLYPDSAIKKLISLFSGLFEKSPLMCRPGPLEKSPLICRPAGQPGLVQTSNLYIKCLFQKV